MSEVIDMPSFLLNDVHTRDTFRENVKVKRRIISHLLILYLGKDVSLQLFSIAFYDVMLTVPHSGCGV